MLLKLLALGERDLEHGHIQIQAGFFVSWTSYAGMPSVVFDTWSGASVAISTLDPLRSSPGIRRHKNNSVFPKWMASFRDTVLQAITIDDSHIQRSVHRAIIREKFLSGLDKNDLWIYIFDSTKQICHGIIEQSVEMILMQGAK